MLVNTKARVGVFSIALGAYLPQFPSLVPEFESQYAAFKKTLPDTVEVIDGGMVTTKEQAMEAGDKFRAADVDLVFLQMLTLTRFSAHWRIVVLRKCCWAKRRHACVIHLVMLLGSASMLSNSNRVFTLSLAVQSS